MLLAFAAVAAGTAAQHVEIERGKYISHAGGCAACHTDEAANAVPYAGGPAIETPFGVFYGPNITPHPQAGIGAWTESDFFRAMRDGIRSDGAHYYPAFPFPSYTKMTDADLRDLWAYLRKLPRSSRKNRSHDLGFGFDQRIAVAAWKQLYFTSGPFTPDPDASPTVNRGAYLVQALGHCDACHTPRTFLGGPQSGRFLAGGAEPDGHSVPNLTPTGLAKYTDRELTELLSSGVKPDGDILSDRMDVVIEESTSRLTPTDLAAMVAYLRTLAPLPDD